jgi:hypothetical protein
MTHMQSVTLVFLFFYVLLGAAYDIWVAKVNSGPSATISWMITWISQQWWGASLVFALGYLMGHFFAQDAPVALTLGIASSHLLRKAFSRTITKH